MIEETSKMNLLTILTEGISFSADVSDEDKAIIRDQIMRDNKKFVIIWASIESVYWIFDLIMSIYKHDFYLCRNAYAGALTVCLAALLMTLLFTRKDLKLIPLAAVMTELALLGAGIGIACYQDTRTIVLFAAVPKNCLRSGSIRLWKKRLVPNRTDYEDWVSEAIRYRG